jgi:CRISPR-associated protein Cas2
LGKKSIRVLEYGGEHMYVVVVYDIGIDENGAKVWKKVFQTCKKYLSHVQNSVFEGEISESQIFQLRTDLNKLIRKELDSVIIFKSRHERWLDKDILGKNCNATSSFI